MSTSLYHKKKKSYCIVHASTVNTSCCATLEMMDEMGISTTTTGKRRDAHPPGGNGVLLFKLYIFSEHPPFGRRAVRLLVPGLEVKVLSELWEVSKFITETRFTFFSWTYRISTHHGRHYMIMPTCESLKRQAILLHNIKAVKKIKCNLIAFLKIRVQNNTSWSNQQE